MRDPTETELEAALADVRRSYRVVVAYQRRMNEIFHRFHLGMADLGLPFAWWYPSGYAPPLGFKEVQFAPNKWAWDLFPGFQLAAAWERPGPPARHVVLLLQTDDAWTKPPHGEPDPSDFAPVETAHTRLWVGLHRADDAAPSPNWGEVRRWFVAHREAATLAPVPWAVAGATGRSSALRVPVARLVDAGAVTRELVEPVRRWLDEG